MLLGLSGDPLMTVELLNPDGANVCDEYERFIPVATLSAGGGVGELVLRRLFILALASVLAASGLLARLLPFLAREELPFLRLAKLSSSRSLLYLGVPAALCRFELAKTLLVALAFLAAPFRPPLLPTPMHFAKWVAYRFELTCREQMRHSNSGLFE